MEPEKDFSATAIPKICGLVMPLAFPLAKGAPNPELALSWLEICMSNEGQKNFNLKKARSRSSMMCAGCVS
jgi:hypothetical protein